MSTPRRLIAPECDVQRLQVSFHVGRCWRELERKACDSLSTRDQANAAACPKVVDLRHASIEEHHRASCVPRHGPSCRLAIEDGSAPISSSRRRSHTLPPGQPHPYVRWTIWELAGGRRSLSDEG